MNIHKNARLTPLRRGEMARAVIEGRLSKAQAARASFHAVAARHVQARRSGGNELDDGRPSNLLDV